jgi:hypothetical protein
MGTTTRASAPLCALIFDVRLMSWVNCGVLNISRWKNVIANLNLLSKEPSIQAWQATTCSKYWRAPLKCKIVRAGGEGVSVEAYVGFSGQGEIDGIRIQ